MTAANEVRTLPQRCPSTLLILFVSASTKLEGAWNEPRTPLLPDNRASHLTNTKFITLTTVQLPGNGSSMFELNPFTGHSYKVKFIDPRRSVKMLPELGRKERGEIYVKCWKWNPGKFFFWLKVGKTRWPLLEVEWAKLSISPVASLSVAKTWTLLLNQLPWVRIAAAVLTDDNCDCKWLELTYVS